MLCFYLVFALIFVLAQFSGYLGIYGVKFTVVIWPAMGIFGAALALTERKHWGWLVGIMLAIDLGVSIIEYRGRYSSELIGFWAMQVFVNPCTGLLFAYIVQEFVDEHNPLSNPKSLGIYIFGAIGINVASVSLIGWSGYGLFFDDIDVIASWQQWAYSDIMGLLTIATPLILLSQVNFHASWISSHRIEGIALLALFTVTLILIYGSPQDNESLLRFYQTVLLLPFFVWAIARFGPLVLTCMASLLTLVVLFSLAAERGPFAIEGRSEHANALVAHGVMLPIHIGILFVSSMLEQQRRHYEQQLRVEQQLRRLDRFETLGTMAGGVAHDFGNFAIALRSYRSVLDSQLKDRSDLTDEALAGIEEIAASAQTMTRSLLSFAREEIHDIPRQVRSDLSAVARSSAAALRPLCAKTNSLHDRIPEDPIYVAIGSTDLKRMISNLVLNAVDASPNATPVRLVVEEDRTHAKIIVEDYGDGMTREVQDRIFDPYFTTKPKGKGTGLGLSVVAGIVYELKGDIEVSSSPGSGTTITISLPKLDADELDAFEHVEEEEEE